MAHICVVQSLPDCIIWFMLSWVSSYRFGGSEVVVWRKLISLNLVRKACMFAQGTRYLNLEGERLVCGVRDMQSMNCAGNCS